MRKKELEAAFHENDPVVQYAFVQFLSEHIADCSRVFGGDLQQMLILSIIGQVFITNFKRAGGPPSPEATTAISALASPTSADSPGNSPPQAEAARRKKLDTPGR